MKKLTLIDNWRSSWKLASFQIAMLLILLESLQAFYPLMSVDAANVVRPIILMLIPIVRLIKQGVKDV